MLGVLFGLVVTYVIAPIVLYPVIYRRYQDSNDATLRSAVVALSFAPIGISLALLLLLRFIPGQRDVFYITAVIALLGGIGLLNYHWCRPIVARCIAVLKTFHLPRQPLIALVVLIRLAVLVLAVALVIRYAPALGAL